MSQPRDSALRQPSGSEPPPDDSWLVASGPTPVALHARAKYGRVTPGRDVTLTAFPVVRSINLYDRCSDQPPQIRLESEIHFLSDDYDLVDKVDPSVVWVVPSGDAERIASYPLDMSEPGVLALRTGYWLYNATSLPSPSWLVLSDSISDGPEHAWQIS